MQNAHKCRVRVLPGNDPGNTRTRTRVILQGHTRTPDISPSVYRANRSSGDGYGYFSIPGTGMEVVHATHTSVGYGYCPVMTWVIPVQYPHISTRAYPYPGYFSIGVQSEQKFRGRVWKSYMQNAHKCRVRVIPGNYPGNTRTVPDSSGRKKQN